MTSQRVVALPPRRDPGDIRGGDEVYLNHAGERSEFRRLALLCLDSSLGGSGPFTVLGVADGRAHLEGGGGAGTFSVSLSSVTRERPLSAAAMNPFAYLRMPEPGLAIKP